MSASFPHGVTVISQLSFRPLFRRARAHFPVRHRERVVAQRRVADSDVAVEDGVEGERCAAVVLGWHVLEAAGQYLRVEDGAGSESQVDIGALCVDQEHLECLAAVVDGVVDDRDRDGLAGLTRLERQCSVLRLVVDSCLCR